MFTSDLQERNNQKMPPFNEFIFSELRTRYYHPKWIEEMQEEGCSGTLAVLDTIPDLLRIQHYLRLQK